MSRRNDFSDEQLFRVKLDEYPEKYIDHLIEQYKLYVQSHEKISERREGSNKFFLGLNAAIVGGIVALVNASKDQGGILIIVSLSAIAICTFWYQSIQSYDSLNTGKFKVIHAIEKRLPLALYESEWIALGRGHDPSLYRPISHLERSVPIAFGLIYVSVIFWKILLP